MEFETIYKEYWDKIFRLCMGYVNDYNLAQDMAQETFLKVWIHLPAFRNEANISTWIFRIATNYCFRQLENKKRISLTELPIHLVEEEQEDVEPQIKMISLYGKVNESKSNSDYLNDLLAIKSKERLMQTKIMNLYFILLSLGIALYMYEYTLYISPLFGIIAYLVTFLWVAFNWFFLRPRIIKRNKEKVDWLIEQIEKIKSQLDKT